MSSESPPLDLSALCELGGVTARTVRYYIQRGLLPSPGRGPGTQYTQAHLDRLRLIRQLQREHLPLAAIRERLEQLDDDQVARVLGQTAEAPAKRRSDGEGNAALGYIRKLQTEGGKGRSQARPSSAHATKAEPFPIGRAQWERLTLTENLELHVRRPLSRVQNRRLERLLAEARRILAGEDPEGK